MDKAPKIRRTLGISRKLPNPSRLTFKDPSKAKKKPLSVKRTGVKKGIAGTVGGAALGAMAGGPLGAIAGGAAGHLAEKKLVDKKMRKGIAGTVGGAALGAMAGGVPGAIAGGAAGDIGEKLLDKKMRKGIAGNVSKQETPNPFLTPRERKWLRYQNLKRLLDDRGQGRFPQQAPPYTLPGTYPRPPNKPETTTKSMKKSREQRYVSLMLSKALSSMLPEIVKEIKKDGFDVPVKVEKGIGSLIASGAKAALPSLKAGVKSTAKTAGKAAMASATPKIEAATQRIGTKIGDKIGGLADKVSTKLGAGLPETAAPAQSPVKSLDSKKKLRREVDVKKILPLGLTAGGLAGAAIKNVVGSQVKEGVDRAAAKNAGKMQKSKVAKAKKEIEKKIPNTKKLKKGGRGALAGGAIGSSLGPLGMAGGAYLGHLLENKLKPQPEQGPKLEQLLQRTLGRILENNLQQQPVQEQPVQGPKSKRRKSYKGTQGETRTPGPSPASQDNIDPEEEETARRNQSLKDKGFVFPGGGVGKMQKSKTRRWEPSLEDRSKNIQYLRGQQSEEDSLEDYKNWIEEMRTKKSLRKGIKKGYLRDNNSELTSATSKVTRDNDRFTEDTVTTLSRKDQNIERSELDMAKSQLQASMKVEKAIFYLQGYEPMDDAQVKKSFHGQIPDLMKEIGNRPPQEWWVKTINKSSAFDNDPIQYTADLWYGDLNKAVAENIDSDYAPKKKGENNQISDGSRVDVSDLVGDGKSETTETL